MRVVDLDRDMSDVIPTGSSLDSVFLFERMKKATFAGLGDPEGLRVVDVAAGVGQDGRSLARGGAWAVGVEPSERMTALAALCAEKEPASTLGWVRGWSEALPFRGRSFDAAFCKGALDHFDDPLGCIREAARITRAEGRVVFAVANFESLACRLSRMLDRLRIRLGKPTRGRRHYDVPSDHFTRYDPELLRAQLERYLKIEAWVGVSLLWGLPGWSSFLRRIPPTLAARLLQAADWLARARPAWADVIVATGRPLPFS
ncbi:MAG: class I SAM-dependent methyltransferase [Myxococcota bacterium]